MLKVRNLVSDHWSMNPDFMLENYTKMPLIHKRETFDKSWKWQEKLHEGSRILKNG